MRVVEHFVPTLKWIVFASALGFAFSCGSDDACQTRTDCASNSELSERIGRCNSEIVCESGHCYGECVERCSVSREDVNPCTKPDFVCNEPMVPKNDDFYCRAHEITCKSLTDCPKYRPVLSESWTCDDGVCRFPGFKYSIEGPVR
jgi:hypothetical protein